MVDKVRALCQGSRRCQRPSRHANLTTLLAIFSVVAQGHAFARIGFPMAQTSSGGPRIRRSSDAALLKIGGARDSISSNRGWGITGSSASAAGAPRMSGSESGEEELSFVDKFKNGWSTVIPVGDPDALPPCPSGVSEMAKPLQAAVVAAVFAGLGAGTVALLGGLSSLEALLPAGWYSAWQSSWAPVLGFLFAAAGVSHFTILKDFCNIYPGRGAWGVWYLPGTASFHVKWTGIAEFVGGVGLALGGLGVGGGGAVLERAAAAGLFTLTLAVTPANVYMFTHGAQLPEGVEVPVVGHAIRGFFQCVLLAFFWTLANQ